MNRDFWVFFAGETISNFGSSFTQFAFPLIVYKLTGSAVALGLAVAAYTLPNLLFGLFAGAWIDRVRRKRLMIVTDLASAVIVASVPLASADGILSIGWVYAAIFGSAVAATFFEIAEFTAIPSLVGQADLVTANGRIQASYAAASIGGPIVAGALVAFFPVETVLLIDALTFLVSAAALWVVRTDFNAGVVPRRTSIRTDIVEGLRYVMAHPVLRNISIMMALVNFVGASRYAQIVLFAKERFEASDSAIGLLFSAGGAGVFALSLLAGPLRARWSFAVVALGALMVNGVLFVIMAIAPSYALVVLLWGVGNGLGTLFNINTGSLRQAITPNHLLGRIISVARVVAWGATPLGALVGGYVIERTGSVALVYGAIGVLVFLIPAYFAFFSPLGHAERYLGGGVEAAR